jgi:hypothetical protein
LDWIQFIIAFTCDLLRNNCSFIVYYLICWVISSYELGELVWQMVRDRARKAGRLAGIKINVRAINQNARNLLFPKSVVIVALSVTSCGV